MKKMVQRMKLARAKRKQYEALNTARAWGRSKRYHQFKRWVRTAAAVHPLTDMQWWNLQDVVGSRLVRELQDEINKNDPN